MSNVQTWTEGQEQAFDLRGRLVEPALRRISYEGDCIEVEPRVMAVLLILAEKPSQTIRRAELIDRIWNGAPGADQSLNNAVSLLRRALRDSRDGQPIITTVPKQGYQLGTAPTMHVDGKRDPISGDDPTALRSTALSRNGRRVGLGVLATAAAVLFAAWIGRAPEPPVPDTPARPRSIAVLPFDNLGADSSDAYFGDGLADEVLHTLSQLRSLEVAPRSDSFQFRDSGASVSAIADSLNVANVLQGTVRREGSRLRITAQLVSAADNAVIWSTSYDRPTDEVLSVQQDIALNITNSLIDEINGAETLDALPTVDGSAYENYMIGKHELRKWTPDGNRRAVAHLERAVSQDPQFAEAHLALGRAYYFAGTHYGWMKPLEAIPKVKSSVVFGISAANPVTRATALAVYGDVLVWGDQDWEAALLAYQRAYELTGVAPLGYGLTLSILGRHDEAIQLFQSLLVDNAGPGLNDDAGVQNNLAWAYFNARRYGEALVEAQKVIDLDGGFADAYRVLGRATLMLGDAQGAYEAFSTATLLMNGAAVSRSDQAVALARAGRYDEARDALAELESSEDYVPAPLIAQVYANLGEHDAAIRWIREAVDDAERGVVFLGINPLYDPIRDDARFKAILSDLNLGQ